METNEIQCPTCNGQKTVDSAVDFTKVSAFEIVPWKIVCGKCCGTGWIKPITVSGEDEFGY